MNPCVRCGKPVASGGRVCHECGSLQPARPLADLLAPGAVIERGYGRYSIERELGAGAMGTVYSAWLFFDPRGPRAHHAPEPYAIKVLRSEGSQHDGEVRGFFLGEAEAMRLLEHPNVVRFHELFEVSGTLALAMEFIKGDDLDAIIARHVQRARGGFAGMQVARAWFYFQQLLGALAATHALGIVHRDVKPSNVMVRGDGIVKLTDYGIAELGKHAAALGIARESQMVPGTGPYMSPEQVQGLPLDGRSDLYSAAIVFYEMLTGRLPYDVDDKTEWLIRLQHVHEAPHPIGAFLPGASPALEQVFARAFAKFPEYRQQTATELGEQFRLALGMPDTAEWRAYAELASVAARNRGRHELLQPDGVRMKTLRAVIAQKLATAQMVARG